MSWATKRKLLYGFGVFCVVFASTAFLFYKVYYKAPTCSDHIQNGDETGIDCGGSCQVVCTSDALSPLVLWSKAFNISGAVYNVAAYIVNPNISSENLEAHYTFKLYDSTNELLASRDGVTFIPANKKFIVFEPNFNIPNNTPTRVDFEFTSLGSWQKVTQPDPDISINYSPLQSTSTSPRIQGTVTNNSLKDISTVELSGLVSDSQQNVVAISRTFVDNLAVGMSEPFVFTWPKPFNLGVEVCTQPVDVAVVFDRSGSMRSESLNPPEPFTTVKNTAKSFVQNLSADDAVSVFSFGNNAVMESALASGTPHALSAIDTVTLASTSEQTDLGDGLQMSGAELLHNGTHSTKVLVVLTDGIPTEPTQKNTPTYPQTYASQIAGQLKSNGITVYTIGLGNAVDANYLQTIATDSAHYFYAPDKTTLASIYGKIAQSLCQKKPSTIQVIDRIPH